MNKLQPTINDKCFICECYWQNNDTGEECEGAEQICHEFRNIFTGENDNE